MCPDPQILSIYMDGELPSPWKEKMEAHLAVCPKCKERLGNYKYMQDLFKRGVSHVPEDQKRIIVERDGSEAEEKARSETELLEKSKERVWKKLAGKQRYNPAGFIRKSGNIKGYSLWRRKLAIPLPVAAAAALLVIFGVAFYMQNRNAANYNQITEYPNLIEEMPSNYIPAAADINSVLQYLDANGTDIIILQLPESRNFSRTGEPEIIRSADYSRAGNTAPRSRQGQP